MKKIKQNKALEILGYTNIPLEDASVSIENRFNKSPTIMKFTKKAKIKSLLGEGSNGFAYELTNGNVLKITSERDEAVTSQEVAKIRHPNIIEIYGVTTLKMDGDKVVHLILEEKVKTDKELFTKIIGALADGDYKKGREILWDILLNNTFKYNQIFEMYRKLTYGNEDIEINGVDSTLLLKFGLDITNAMNRLAEAGINYFDLHRSNCGMKDTGDFVIFDFGMSKTGNEDKKVERVIKEIRSMIKDGKL